ncbi:MAG: phage tail tape measure protein, partial [Ruminococcus sp.]|nr:phage tail tape measure protein [Ruminococcus sp.]
MANRIRGITVEINGDTTNLQKALSGVDKSIGKTQSQLRDVEKLLKLDPTNTELLSQKQRLLGEAVK